MSITKPRLLGRFTKGHRTVNMYTGRNMQRGTDHYFYYRSGDKVMISDADFHHNWSVEVPTKEQEERRARAKLMQLSKEELIDMVFQLNNEVFVVSNLLDESNEIRDSYHNQIMSGMTSRGGVTVPKNF